MIAERTTTTAAADLAADLSGLYADATAVEALCSRVGRRDAELYYHLFYDTSDARHARDGVTALRVAAAHFALWLASDWPRRYAPLDRRPAPRPTPVVEFDPGDEFDAAQAKFADELLALYREADALADACRAVLDRGPAALAAVGTRDDPAADGVREAIVAVKVAFANLGSRIGNSWALHLPRFGE